MGKMKNGNHSRLKKKINLLLSNNQVFLKLNENNIKIIKKIN